MNDDEPESIWEHVVFFILVVCLTVGGLWLALEFALWAVR